MKIFMMNLFKKQVSEILNLCFDDDHKIFILSILHVVLSSFFFYKQWQEQNFVKLVIQLNLV